MTDSDVATIKVWLDLGLKAIIGLIVSVVGWDYKNAKETLQDLQKNKYELQAQTHILQREVQDIKRYLERIEKKLDGMK